MRRFTPLTNGFSKKIENHAAAVALHFIHYNFARIHKTLRITPAMAAGISDHVWSYEEIAALANREGDEMKALDPQRLRMVLYFFLQALFVAALFVENHIKAHMGVVLPTALGAALFSLAGLHALYNLSPDSN
jgi:hypothetical protein